MFEKIGHLKNYDTIELFKKDGIVYACSAWNGEQYNDCWNLEDETDKTKYIVKPIYKETSEDEFDIVDIEITHN